MGLVPLTIIMAVFATCFVPTAVALLRTEDNQWEDILPIFGGVVFFVGFGMAIFLAHNGYI